MVADLLELLANGGQCLVSIGNNRGRVHLVRLELGRIDIDELGVRAVQPLGSGGEVGVASADTDNNVSFMRQLVGSNAAGGAQTAEVQLMRPLDGALARLRLAERDTEVLRELLKHLVRLGIAYAATADQERLLGVLDDLDSLLQCVLGDRTTVDAPNALLEEVNRVVICFCLYVLWQGDCNRTGVGRVGQHAHCGDHVGHDLLGAVDTAPILGDSLECVMRGNSQVMRLLHLLEYRVRLAGSVNVAR